MKTAAFLLLAAVAAVTTVAVPSLVGVVPEGPSTPAEAPGPEGVLLRGEASSGAPCRIVVEPGLDTRVDRGVHHALSTPCTFEGGFRYWEEPLGRVLYVYDDVQNLVSRIVNPRSVRVLPVGVAP